MNNSINLLTPEVHNRELQKRLQILRIVSFGILLFIVVTSVSLFSLILTSPLPALRSQENAAALKLTELRNKSAKLYLIRDRLGSIDTILNSRLDFNALIMRVKSELPEGVVVERIEIDHDVFSLTLSSRSLYAINTFITAMKSIKENEKKFSSITLTALQYDNENPKYSMRLQSRLSL